MSKVDAGSDSSDSAKTADSQSGVTKRRHTHRKMCSPIVADEPSQSRRRVKLKMPPFSPEDPELWFALLEGQFESMGITEDAVKFNNVIMNIDVAHAKTVKDVIINPPLIDRYNKIKSVLIKRLTASHEEKVRQLLSHEELGDRKPTQFLRHLRDLAGPSIPEDFLRSIWSNRLPRGIQTILASQPYQDLEQLAELADRIQEISTPETVAAASAPQGLPNPGPSGGPGPKAGTSSEIAELKRMVERLTMKVDQHTRQSRQPQRSGHQRHHNRSSSRSATRSASSYRQYPICWYHAKFRSRAHKCQTPCDYGKSENAAGNRQ